MATTLNTELSETTAVFGLKVWELVGILIGLLIVAILFALTFYLTSQKKSKQASGKKTPFTQIPIVSKEIKEVKVEEEFPNDEFFLTIRDKSSDGESDTVRLHVGQSQTRNGEENYSQLGSFRYLEKEGGGSSGKFSVYRSLSSDVITVPSPLTGLPEFSHLGWGHWFTLRDLELATNGFLKDNVIGEGGYGVVYRGQLVNGTNLLFYIQPCVCIYCIDSSTVVFDFTS